MTAQWITADVFDGLATLETGSVDLVVTSPPFLALRSYLPADHPDKGKEIGSEATPAEWLDVLLRVTAELRRVLAPHGSICVELGDTYAGTHGAGGDYNEVGLRDGGAPYRESTQKHAVGRSATRTGAAGRSLPGRSHWSVSPSGPGWPLAKSRTLIPQLYEIALAYGINPLTGASSPAGQWRIRNVVTWARPNPPVGALGDKWRPATSDLIVACVSPKRYWDDLATRRPASQASIERAKYGTVGENAKSVYSGGKRDSSTGDFVPGAGGDNRQKSNTGAHPSGAPLLDYWEMPPGGYKGSHYAVFPEELVVPCVKAMCPEKVCRTCGEPSRRIVSEPEYVQSRNGGTPAALNFSEGERKAWKTNRWDTTGKGDSSVRRVTETLGWTDCGHDDYRPGLILDPFAGSGTTLSVATGHGHNAIGIDLDPRNADLARDRIGPFLFDEVTV